MFNNYENKRGLFIVRFNEDDLNKWEFVLRVKNKVEIDDCNIFVMRDNENKFKELIVSYKVIFVNTYNM